MTFILNKKKHTVKTASQTIHLTPREFGILSYLIRHHDKYVSAEELYEAIWKAEPFNCHIVVAVHVRHIREKIEEDPSHPVYLKMKRNKGYIFSEKNQ